MLELDSALTFYPLERSEKLIYVHGGGGDIFATTFISSNISRARDEEALICILVSYFYICASMSIWVLVRGLSVNLLGSVSEAPAGFDAIQL